ncbi:MAG TPA: TolC family protein [Armatimonadota bacterium]|jgi:outer membrane protein TolC
MGAIMKTWILILLLSALGLPSVAEDQKPLQLDLQSAIRMALDHNPGIASVKEGESIARARLDQAKSSDALRLNAGTGYSYLTKATLFGGMTVLDKNTNMNTISASKPIYTGGMSQAAREQARWGIAASTEQTTTAQEEMVLAVTETFVRALDARDNVRVADDAVTFLQANLDAAVKMKDAGTAPKSDVFRAETEVASANESRIQAQTAYKTQLAVLRNLLSLEPDVDLSLTDALPGLKPADEASASGTSESQRAEVRALEDAVKAAEANVKKVQAGRRPVVSVSADYLNIGTGAEFPRMSNTFSVGIGASLPLSDGGATRANVSEAKAALRKAQKDLDSMKQRVALEREQANLALNSATARVASSDARLKSAQESARALRVSYQEGIASITDVLGARAALTEAESARVNSLYDKYVAQVQLLKADGRIMSIISPPQ